MTRKDLVQLIVAAATIAWGLYLLHPAAAIIFAGVAICADVVIDQVYGPKRNGDQ